MGFIGPHPGPLAAVVAAFTRGRGGRPIYGCPHAHFWAARGAGSAFWGCSGALLAKIGVLMAESGEGEDEALAWRGLAGQGKGIYAPLARFPSGRKPLTRGCLLAWPWRSSSGNSGRRWRGEGRSTVVWHQRPVMNQRLCQIVWALRVPESPAAPFHPYVQLLMVPTHSENCIIRWWWCR